MIQTLKLRKFKFFNLKTLSLFLTVGGIFFLIAFPSFAQSINIDFGEEGVSGSAAGKVIQIIALLTILSLAPSILIMTTSFTRLIVVLSFVRNALWIQQTPPNMVLISLALFLTGFIMAPTLEKVYSDAVVPLIKEQIKEDKAFELAIKPIHHFMAQNVREKDLQLFMDLSKTEPVASVEDVPIYTLIPAFMISELRRAFEIGFLLFLPFLIIDMVVASILMSMGMMMVPPIMIALPFKIIFFVLVDGWHLIAGSLVKGYLL